MTDTTTIADTTQEVTEATQQAVKQVNQITQYLQDSIPGLITFGLEVLAALVAFFIGRLVIKWIRKIVRRCRLTFEIWIVRDSDLLPDLQSWI